MQPTRPWPQNGTGQVKEGRVECFSRLWRARLLVLSLPVKVLPHPSTSHLRLMASWVDCWGGYSCCIDISELSDELYDSGLFVELGVVELVRLGMLGLA
jgi:hypothetical protein